MFSCIYLNFLPAETLKFRLLPQKHFFLTITVNSVTENSKNKKAETPGKCHME